MPDVAMRIIARKTLRVFWERPEYADSEQPLRAWFRAVSRADWTSPADVKTAYRSASIVGNDRIVFNIAGNKYRLVVRVNYPYRVVYIRFVGTHRQYDGINVREV
jgi:mRNA interferase HigB